MENFDLKELQQKMNKSIASFQKDLSTLRTGRANPSMLDLIRNRCLWTKNANQSNCYYYSA